MTREQQAAFQRNTLTRALGLHGVSYRFYRQKRNGYGEPLADEAAEAVALVCALRHDVATREHVLLTPDEGGKVRDFKPKTMLLCLISAVSRLLEVGDLVTVDGEEYTITDIADVQHMGYAYDISLENVNG